MSNLNQHNEIKFEENDFLNEKLKIKNTFIFVSN